MLLASFTSLIRNLNPNKATGSDEISGQMLLASFTSLIRNLNPNKATGSDEISGQMLLTSFTCQNHFSKHFDNFFIP